MIKVTKLKYFALFLPYICIYGIFFVILCAELNFIYIDEDMLEQFANIIAPTSLAKLFHTYDNVIGANPIYIIKDDNYQCLFRLGVICEKEGTIEDTGNIPAFAVHRESKFRELRNTVLRTEWCRQLIDLVGDDGVNAATVLELKGFTNDQVRNLLWWMDNLNIITKLDSKYVIADDEELNEDIEEEFLNTDSIWSGDINLKEDKYSVFEYLRKIEKSPINLRPDFQRSLVWSNKQKSKFIESVILDIPLPPFYLKRDEENALIMVDGLQRTACLRDFFAGEFELEGLEMLRNLNGCDIKKLQLEYPQYLARLEDKQIHAYIMSPTVKMEIVYDIFERINTGGTKLERQEIRNCIYIGKSTKLLKDIASSKVFIDSIDKGILPTRMKDREAVLRCLAFVLRDYKTEYIGSMDEFLNGTMRMLNKKTDAEIETIRETALKVYGMALELYGRYNFRLPTQFTRGRISIAVMETFFYVLWHISDEDFAAHKEQLRGMQDAIFEDEDYEIAVRYSTNNKYRVDTRFSIIKSMVDDILNE